MGKKFIIIIIVMTLLGLAIVPGTSFLIGFKNNYQSKMKQSLNPNNIKDKIVSYMQEYL